MLKKFNFMLIENNVKLTIEMRRKSIFKNINACVIATCKGGN